MYCGLPGATVAVAFIRAISPALATTLTGENVLAVVFLVDAPR
jgi:hypothetical protein